MQKTSDTKGLDIAGLTGKARKAAEAIVAELKRTGRENTGGCRAFYSPKEWKDRGEEYGTGSVLVVVHDGGDHAGCFSYEYEEYEDMERMNEALRKVGFYVEQCTGWYSAVYEV